MESEQRALTGWGRTAPSVATLVRASADDLRSGFGDLIARTDSDRGIIARGLGRSYGDPAQNGGGFSVDGPERFRFTERSEKASRHVMARKGFEINTLDFETVPFNRAEALRV